MSWIERTAAIAIGLGEFIEQHLTELRRGKNTQFPLADLFRQSVYSPLAGYEERPKCWPTRRTSPVWRGSTGS